MLRRIWPVGVLAAALLIAAISVAPVSATEDSAANYQLTRTRDLPRLPGDREPVATPAPGDDDTPNRHVRQPAPIPQASSVAPAGPDAGPGSKWYLTLWQRFLRFGSEVVFFMKA